MIYNMYIDKKRKRELKMIEKVKTLDLGDYTLYINSEDVHVKWHENVTKRNGEKEIYLSLGELDRLNEAIKDYERVFDETGYKDDSVKFFIEEIIGI